MENKNQNRVCFEALINDFGKIWNTINHFKGKVCWGFKFQVLTNSLQKLAI